MWLDKLKISLLKREYLLYIDEKLYRVDCYDKSTNTIYEFLGDCWHGNPRRYDKNDTNVLSKKTFGQLYNETLERILILSNEGFVVKFVWECDYRSGNMFSEEL